MRSRALLAISSIMLLALLLAACAPSAAATQAPPYEAPGNPEVFAAPTQMPAQEQAPAAGPAATMAAPMNPSDPELAAQAYGTMDHMIIKNGDMRLLVRDTDQALDGVTQVIGDVHGYVISSRVWFQDYYGTNYKYATLTIGVPVDQFELALRRFRALAIRVMDDNASGEDVTSQYVDLQSQLGNLEATRDRIRGFLDQATTVDEALRINQQLSDVEVQIEKIKGQMNYLSNRSAFSTVTVNLEPDLPKIEVTPTPTMTPTPVPELGPWDPGRTTHDATNTLVGIYRLLIDALIWVVVVLLPIFGPPALLVWLVVWLVRRKRQPAQPPSRQP